jgi:hypothetical protein
VQRLLGPPCELAVDGDEIARPRHLARDDDLVLAQPGLDGQLRRVDGGDHHAFVEDFLRRAAEVPIGVFLHLGDDQLLIERAAVNAYAYGPVVIDRDFADGGELLVAPPASADVAGVDAVLVERRGARRVARQQQVAVVVEVADERRRAAGVQHPPLDLGNGCSGLGQIHRDAHHLGPSFGELDALLRRGCRVRRIGHRHRLHDDRSAAANLDRADLDADSLVEANGCGHRVNHSKRQHGGGARCSLASRRAAARP